MDTNAFTSEGLWMLVLMIASIAGIIISITWNMRVHKSRKYLAHLWSDVKLQRNKEKEMWALTTFIISLSLLLAIVGTLFYKI